MKVGDRVAVKVSEINDMLGYYNDDFNEHMKARAVIKKVYDMYFWVTWDKPCTINDGGWFASRFIPEDLVHLETL
jgi:hypothetical protein